MLNKGELGKVSIEANGALSFSNFNGGMTSLSYWEGGNNEVGNSIKWDYLGSDNNEIGISEQLNISAYGMGTISSLLPAVLKNTGAGRIAIETLTVATKFTSEKLFGVGVVLSGMNIVNNKFSTNSILWGIADTGMGILGFVPGVQVISGLYFTGRIAYQIYDEINK